MAMTLRLDEKMEARLDKAATNLGISKTRFIEAAILEKLNRENQQDQASEIIDRILQRDKEVLDRLSDA